MCTSKYSNVYISNINNGLGGDTAVAKALSPVSQYFLPTPQPEIHPPHHVQANLLFALFVCLLLGAEIHPPHPVQANVHLFVSSGRSSLAQCIAMQQERLTILYMYGLQGWVLGIGPKNLFI